jgi:polysaccharide biosynthesis protein PelD
MVGAFLVDQGIDRHGSKGSNEDGADTLMRHRFLPTRSGVIELIVLFAMLLAIERLLMSPGDFAKLQPHPYWLPVILLSLQYGTADGILAAAVAIVAGLLMGSPTQGVVEEYYRYLIRVWAVPIGWITSAILIGEIRARQRSQTVELKRDLDTRNEQAEDITQHCHRLEEKIERLEREFATIEANSLDSLTASLEDLTRGDAEEWNKTFARVHRGLVGTGSISLVLRNDLETARVAWATMTPEKMTPEKVAPDTDAGGRTDPAALAPIVDAVISSRRGLSALRPDEAALFDGVAAMAVPLATEPGGRVVGVIVLETVAPERLTIDTENRLRLFARETAHALALRGFDDLIEAAAGDARLTQPNADRALEPAGAEAGVRRLGLFQRLGRA